MATITFVLKEPNSEIPTTIFALIRFKKTRVKYSIGFSILPNFWDKETQRAIEKKSELKNQKIHLSGADISDNKSVNIRISRLVEFKSKLFTRFEISEVVPTSQRVRKELNNKFNPQKNLDTVKRNLNQYIDYFICEIESGERLTDKGKQYNFGTVKMYKGFQSQFEKYQNQRKRTLDFNDIDLDFYRDYIRFFNEKDYSPNTIGRHIKTLKVIMGASQLQKLHDNNQFRLKDFKGITEKVNNIYLDLEELEKLYRLDLTAKPDQERARDVFLVGCFTALRFSDYSRIKPHHIQKTSIGQKVIRIETRKTGEEVIIPFWHWILDELIEKYPEGMPKTYEQKVNEKIKVIGKMAKINQLTNKMVNKQGTKYEVSALKFELIKTHTARRSGATNMYKHGIPTIDIMKITGHTLESNFFKYIKVTKEETADRIAIHHRINKPLKIAK